MGGQVLHDDGVFQQERGQRYTHTQREHRHNGHRRSSDVPIQNDNVETAHPLPVVAPLLVRYGYQPYENVLNIRDYKNRRSVKDNEPAAQRFP